MFEKSAGICVPLLEILKLVEEYKRRHPQASLREIHEAILSCGSIPPKILTRSWKPRAKRGQALYGAGFGLQDAVP